jgi:hypothetical protein
LILDVLLPERSVDLNIDEAYEKVKAVLIEKGCSVVSEEPPKQLLVKQGSLWGLSPRTAKKNIKIKFETIDNETSIKYSSKLARDWKNVTLIGCVLAFAIAVLCVWMAMDLGKFMVDGGQSFWSWIIISGDQVEFKAGEAFVNLAYGLTVFLSVIIVLELAIVVYARSKIEWVIEEALSQLC